MAKAAAAQTTVTLKHLAAALAETHEMAKKQSELILNDLVDLAACRTEVYSMIANGIFVGANVHRTRDRAQSALLRSPIELASRCLGCI